MSFAEYARKQDEKYGTHLAERHDAKIRYATTRVLPVLSRVRNGDIQWRYAIGERVSNGSYLRGIITDRSVLDNGEVSYQVEWPTTGGVAANWWSQSSLDYYNLTT